MTDNQIKWNYEKDCMVKALVELGFPAEIGDAIAANLGSPKAMRRMTGYLINVKPKKIELVIDEMLAICSDIERWREKKASEAANASYTAYLNSDLRSDDDFEEEDW